MNIKSTLAAISVVVILFIGFLMTEKEVQAREFPVQEITIPHENINPDELENFLDEFVPENMERSHVPGLVIVVVRGDKVLVSKGKVMPTSKTRFR